MWYFLGQPSRSGYDYDDDDPDDVPPKEPWTWSDLWSIPLVLLLIFVVLPLTPLIALIGALVSDVSDTIRARKENTQCEERAKDAPAHRGPTSEEQGPPASNAVRKR